MSHGDISFVDPGIKPSYSAIDISSIRSGLPKGGIAYNPEKGNWTPYSGENPPQYASSPIGQGVMENGVVNLMPGAIGGGVTYNPATGEYMKYDGLMPGYSVTQEQAYQSLHPDYSAMAAQPQVIAENWTPTYRSFQYGVPDYPVPQTRTPYQVGPNYSQFQGNPGLQSVANQYPSYRPFMMPQSQTPYRVGPDYGRLMRPSMPQRMFRPQPQTASIQHPQQPFNPFRITSRTPR